MKHKDWIVLLAFVGLGSIAAAPVPVRTATPDEVVDRTKFNEMAERNKLVRVLFGDGKVARGCSFVVIDKSKPYTASNLELHCPGVLDYCDAITADCGDH